jgi:DNA-directed RNA polymerase subunit RPC12/RpoP
MSVKTAMQRMRQRSKLPAGGEIVTRRCATCNGGVLVWSGDLLLKQEHIRCSHCIERDRNIFRAFRQKVAPLA